MTDPGEIQVQVTEAAALIRRVAFLRDHGIEPLGVLMQIPPGMNIDDQPRSDVLRPASGVVA